MICAPSRLPIVVCVILWLFPAVPATAAPSLANVILCMGDDHGWEETGYNGHPHLKTPVLDEMAAKGLRFDRFYAAHPSCSPTRGSVLTGRHPNRYGTFTPNYSTRPEEITIAHLLSRAGYICGHFGKWHVGPVKASSPTNPGAMGFHQWLSHDNFFELNPWFSRNGGPPKQFQGESSQIVIDETIRFIREAKDAGQPFLAVVWFGSPHEPYSGLPQDLALYENLPEAYQQKTVALTSNETGRRVERPQREVLQERFAEITAMDRALGQLRRFLAAEGLRDNTLVWYCGDNGTPAEGQVASPFRGRKGQMYEGGIRVPGVLEWPAKIRKPRVSNDNVVTSDILPTLCEITGQPAPNRPLDGVSLRTLIEGGRLQRKAPIFFWSYQTRGESANKPYIEPELQQGTTPLVKLMGDIATRNFRNFHHPTIDSTDLLGPRVALDGDHKLVIHERGTNSTTKELFDLAQDPAESQNLIDSQPDRAEMLEAQLRRWQESVLNSLTGADYR